MTARPPRPDAADDGVDRVIGVIERLVPEWYGPGARLRGRPPVQRRPWSVHFLPRVTAPGGEIDLIVKIPLWAEAPDLREALAAGPQEATRAEFAMLGRIEAMVTASAEPSLTWVRRVGYIEEINAVVTERLASRTLRAAPRPRRPAAARSAGVWLRLFHDDIGAAADGVLEPSDLLDLDGVEQMVNGLPAALQSAVAGVRSRAEELMGRPIRRATTHGDLGPSNILVTPDGRVGVIDPNLVPAPVEADLAKLAVALRTPRWRLLAGFPFGEGLHPVERAVLEGYGAVPGEIYALCRRLAAVRRWVEIEAESGGVRRIALPMARRVLAAESG
ncbi:MAG: phosphotransferase [Actinomycetota bacterium]